MKFLKNNLKVIIAFVLGLILAGGIVYATSYFAKDVIYKEETSVEQALNDLYTKKENKVRVYDEDNDGIYEYECSYLPTCIFIRCSTIHNGTTCLYSFDSGNTWSVSVPISNYAANSPKVNGSQDQVTLINKKITYTNSDLKGTYVDIYMIKNI